MKFAIAAVILVVMGLVGAVVITEGNRRESAAARRGPVANEAAVIATISIGDEVDVAAHIPRSGLTLVEFTADF